MRERNRDAVEQDAADLVKHGTPALNAALNGGNPAPLTSEQAHTIAASIARDQDKGHVRPTSEYVEEAKRRR